MPLADKTLIRFLLALSVAWVLPASEPSLAENSGFCSGGAPQASPVSAWGTYCGEGDRTMGRAATNTFRLNGAFEMYLSGNPSGEDLHLRLENLNSHESLDIRPNVEPGPAWEKFEFDIPDTWRGKYLRLVAEDNSTGPMGWFAFSMPVEPDRNELRNDAKRILLKTPLFTLLIFLPGFTLCMFAISRGIRGTLKLGLVLLAGIAIPGYSLFFIYVVSPKAGYWISAILPYACAVCLLLLLVRSAGHQRRLLPPFVIPLALTMCGALGALSLGYLYGGTDNPTMTAWNRFSHPLPPDNTLPYLVAEHLRNPPMPKPLFIDWLSSDRPPLQSGMFLALEPWTKSRNEFWYQVTAVIVQSLWIFALWLLLKAFRISRVTAGLVIATIYLSGFAIVNTFFVWPKLLAAAYMVAFALPILAARRQAGRPSWLLRCLMAFLLVCSLLSHGGSVFALLGLGLFMLLRFQRQMVKEACIVGAITVLFYSPWIAYQKFVDPPGDRLLKVHLADVEPVTPEPALKAIIDAYRRQTFSEWIAVKEANTLQVFGHESEYFRALPGFLNPKSKVNIRVLEFFYCVPTLGIAGLGMAGLLLRRWSKRTRNEMTAAERMLLWSFCMTIPWILLMFKANMTIVHAGAYALQLTSMAGSILAFRAVAPGLCMAVCLFQCVFHWIVYEPDLTHAAFPASLALSANYWMMTLHLLSLCGFCALLAVNFKRTKLE